MGNTTVVWGTIKFKGDAQIVSDEIRIIQTKNNDEATPIMIVEYAETHPHSELHKCFTWDDTEAARKYRLVEARMIVRNLVVTRRDASDAEKHEPQAVRFCYRTERTGGYKRTECIIQKPDEKKKLLEIAKAELFAFKRKYAMLSDNELLRRVFLAIDEIA